MFPGAFPEIRKTLRFSELSEVSDSSETVPENFLSHAVQIVIPHVTGLPKPFEELYSPKNNEYLYLEKLPLPSLVDNVFVEAFVKKGSLTAWSVHGSSEEFIKLLPSGKLVVSLRACQRLGLPKDRQSSKKELKTLSLCDKVTVDLLSPSFNPEKKWYKRVISEFQKLCDVEVDFIIAWTPDDPDICGVTSLKKYFQTKEVSARVCRPKQSSCLKYSVPIPEFDFEKLSPNETFLEWIGAQVCGIESGDSGPLMDGFSVTDPGEVAGQVFVSTWQGFYPINCIQKTLLTAREVLSSDESVPFVAGAVHGFSGHGILCFSVFQKSFQYVTWFYV